MNDDKILIEALRRLSVQTGSIACLGCEYEYDCGIHGCAIICAAVKILKEAPAVDVSEIVRCKDCKNYELMKSNNYHFCNEFGGYVTEKDFCSRGSKNGR